MNLIFPKKSGKFNFTISASLFKDYLSKVLLVSNTDTSSTSSKYHIILAKKGKLYVLSYTQDTFAVVQVEEDIPVEGDGYMVIVPSILTGLIKNREEMTFTYDNVRLTFKSTKNSRYAGEINTQHLTDDIIDLINQLLKPDEVTFVINSEILSSLRNGIKMTSIKNVYSGNSELYSYVEYKNKKITVSSVDNWHLSYYSSTLKKSTNDFSFAILPSIFDLIDKFVTKDTKFVFASNKFRVEDNNFILNFPPIQSKEEEFNIVANYIKELPKATVSFEFNDSLSTTVNNLYSLLTTKGLTFDLKIKDSSATLAIKTQQGDARDKLQIKNLKAKENLSVGFDPDIFLDLLKNVKYDGAIFSVIPNIAYMIKQTIKENEELVLIGSLLNAQA